MVTKMFTDEINMVYAKDLRDAAYLSPVSYSEFHQELKR